MIKKIKSNLVSKLINFYKDQNNIIKCACVLHKYLVTHEKKYFY